MLKEASLSLSPDEVIIKWLLDEPSKGQVVFIDGVLKELMDREVDPPRIADLQQLWYMKAVAVGLELEST